MVPEARERNGALMAPVAGAEAAEVVMRIAQVVSLDAGGQEDYMEAGEDREDIRPQQEQPPAAVPGEMVSSLSRTPHRL